MISSIYCHEPLNKIYYFIEIGESNNHNLAANIDLFT